MGVGVGVGVGCGRGRGRGVWVWAWACARARVCVCAGATVGVSECGCWCGCGFGCRESGDRGREEGREGKWEGGGGREGRGGWEHAVPLSDALCEGAWTSLCEQRSLQLSEWYSQLVWQLLDLLVPHGWRSAARGSTAAEAPHCAGAQLVVVRPQLRFEAHSVLATWRDLHGVWRRADNQECQRMPDYATKTCRRWAPG